MTNEDRPLSTADLANSAEERGRSDERVVSRGTQTEAPWSVDRSEAAAGVMPADGKSLSREPSPMRSNVTAGEKPTPLFADRDAEDLRKRWNDVQTSFVDEPRRAVEQA